MQIQTGLCLIRRLYKRLVIGTEDITTARLCRLSRRKHNNSRRGIACLYKTNIRSRPGLRSRNNRLNCGSRPGKSTGI